MIAFDPDEIIVEDAGSALAADGKSIDQKWGMRVPDQGGTAYIRITPQLRDFFKLCQEKHGVIGFEYDFDDAGLNFGLVLRKGEDDAQKTA